jgi:hypothetical protein
VTGRPHYKPTINSSMQTRASEANLAFVKRGGLHQRSAQQPLSRIAASWFPRAH